MEVYRSLEALLVPKSAGIALDLLDHRIEALGPGVGCAGDDGRQDTLEMILGRSRHLIDRLEPRADGPAVPAHPGSARPTPDLIVPQAHGVGLGRPGPGGLQVRRFECLEVTPALVGHVVGVLQPEVATLGQNRAAFARQQGVVLGTRNVSPRRVDERTPHVHGHRSQSGQRLGRLHGIPGVQGRALAVVGDVQHSIFAADHRHILVPAVKRGFVDANGVREILLPARQAARHRAFLHAADRRPAQTEPLGDFRNRADLEPVDHQGREQRRQSAVVLRPGHRQLMDAVLRTPNARDLSDQPSLVLADVEMPPLTLARIVAGARRPALRAGQIISGMMDVDSHAGPSQVDFHFRDLPGRLNTENLAVELAIVHETGLESGPASSLSELPPTHKTGKSLFTTLFQVNPISLPSQKPHPSTKHQIRPSG